MSYPAGSLNQVSAPACCGGPPTWPCSAWRAFTPRAAGSVNFCLSDPRSGRHEQGRRREMLDEQRPQADAEPLPGETDELAVEPLSTVSSGPVPPEVIPSPAVPRPRRVLAGAYADP